MRVVLLTGSHPRHLYVVNRLIETGMVVGHVIEQREEFIPQPPEGLQDIDRENFIRHFADRDASEHHFFKEDSVVKEAIPTLPVTLKELNSQNTIEWIKSLNADVMISYGVHKLTDELLNEGPKHAWNIHGGLSPWYRGNITLFWPFYNLKPNWAGMTIHRLTAQLDGGGIVHHSVPELTYGDGLHDVASKAVMQVAKDLHEILLNINLDKISYVSQKSSGKLFTSSDWQPQHLRVVYNLFNNDIVDKYLDGELPKVEPKLVNIFLDN